MDSRAASSLLMAALAAPGGRASPVLPRTAVVVAHPDDETVGAGSRLRRLADARFVYVTNGAPRDGSDAARHGWTPEHYAEVRRQELAAALACCGIDACKVVSLGCIDQEAALDMTGLAARLAAHFEAERIEAVLTHPCEGGHPDHDATAFAVHAAAALLHRRSDAGPAIVEMSSYHQGPDGLRAGEFLPDARADAGAVTIELTPSEVEAKRALLACFATQQETLRWFPLRIERYRPAPRYDFRQPPHAGPLFYERHPWGMTGERFRALAAQALLALQLEGPL